VAAWKQEVIAREIPCRNPRLNSRPQLLRHLEADRLPGLLPQRCGAGNDMRAVGYIAHLLAAEAAPLGDLQPDTDARDLLEGKRGVSGRSACPCSTGPRPWRTNSRLLAGACSVSSGSLVRKQKSAPVCGGRPPTERARPSATQGTSGSFTPLSPTSSCRLLRLRLPTQTVDQKTMP
jgi:hypothetical protein